VELGITTNIFAGPIAKGEIDLQKILELVRGYGIIRSIEIRDDGASLEEKEVQRLNSIAASAKIRLSYAIKNEMSSAADRALFEKGARLAATLGDGAVLRVLGAQELLKPEGKLGYSAEEGRRIARVAEEYGSFASALGVRVAIENAREPLFGDDRNWGMSELMRATSTGRNVGLTFDPANATSKALCKRPADEEQVLRFVSEFGDRIFLVHYKTTVGGQVRPTLEDGDLRSEKLFEALQRVFDGVLCIEIPGSSTLAETTADIERSLSFLRQERLARFFLSFC
jgi:sugar phosphate isomerase/epimerase